MLPDMAGTRRLTLREASAALGVSIEAVRKRVKRGSLEAEKGPDGRVYVYLDVGTDASPDAGGDEYQTQPEVEGSLVEELRRQNEYLRDQLDIRTQELREHRRLLAAALERIPPQLEAPREPETATEESSKGTGPAANTPAQEPSERRRSWWREFFGLGQ